MTKKETIEYETGSDNVFADLGLDHADELLIRAERRFLVQHEFVDGWHYCPEWDGMLIHRDHPEFEACICNLSKDDE